MSNQPFRNSIGLVGSYLKAESADYAAEAGSFLKNKTGEFVESATQHISSAVVDVTNKTVTAAIEKITQAPINIASELAAGVQDMGGTIASGAASGAQSLGASIASGAAVGYSSAQSLGASIASGASVGLSGAQSLGSTIASGAAVGAHSLGEKLASGASGAKILGSTIASDYAAPGLAKLSTGAAQVGETAGKAALGAGKAVLGAATEWVKGKRGGAINGSMLVSFKELDNIHILKGKQLDAFNESRLGLLLTDIKSEMDVILIENLNKLTDKPIKGNKMNYLDNIISLFMNKAAPYFIKEVELSIPFYEYVKKNKIKFNEKYKSGITKALCNVDIINICNSTSVPLLKKSKHKTRRYLK